jgi:hypothetical protein
MSTRNCIVNSLGEKMTNEERQTATRSNILKYIATPKTSNEKVVDLLQALEELYRRAIEVEELGIEVVITLKDKNE